MTLWVGKCVKEGPSDSFKALAQGTSIMDGGRPRYSRSKSGMCRVSACPIPLAARPNTQHYTHAVLILDGCFAPRQGVDTNSIFAVWPINCNLGAGWRNWFTHRAPAMEFQSEHILVGERAGGYHVTLDGIEVERLARGVSRKVHYYDGRCIQWPPGLCSY